MIPTEKQGLITKYLLIAEFSNLYTYIKDDFRQFYFVTFKYKFKHIPSNLQETYLRRIDYLFNIRPSRIDIYLGKISNLINGKLSLPYGKRKRRTKG